MKLGILGGMGPMATSDFFRKIIELTDASKDQEHIHILIDNNTEIPDRTGYILDHLEDPRREMIRSAIKLEIMGADVLAMPCNTAHFFYNDINRFTDIPVINMIDETAKYLSTHHPNQTSFLLLATQGTYESKVYKTIFKKYGLTILEPSFKDKNQITDWIYEVKAGKLSATRTTFNNLIKRSTQNIKTPVILGCTELPLIYQALKLNGSFIDPTKILAESCIDFTVHSHKETFPINTQKII